jgi:maleate cis-trans isomerase
MKRWRARLGFPNAQAVFLSGTGMPTVKILQALEQDLGKPALSANSAMMWYALRRAGVRHSVSGYGRLLQIHDHQ